MLAKCIAAKSMVSMNRKYIRANGWYMISWQEKIDNNYKLSTDVLELMQLKGDAQKSSEELSISHEQPKNLWRARENFHETFEHRDLNPKTRKSRDA